MRMSFVGADFEENLGVGILASVVERDGHEWTMVPFNTAADTGEVVRRIVADHPDVVGMSIQFQHRAPDFLRLGRLLRDAGYRGHVTSGAQFPTLAYREVLEGGHGIDSVVLHDGEETLPELLAALASGGPLHEVAGLALLGPDGVAFRTEARPLPEDLDAVPFAKRYRAHTRHVGVPFIPLVGSRGCWGRCNYCSIVAFYKDSHDAIGGGKLMRMRSPENIAQEIAVLWHEAGPSIFCFHDDNFTLPSPHQTLARVRAIRQHLDAYGVGLVGFVGKARPDTVTRDLARELAELGVIRLYVGVENGSDDGGDHLRRGTQQRHIEEALAACKESGIFNCYNLLMFEPFATMEHIRQNIRFIRSHADGPVNFCRAEPYHGTPLHVELAADQDLGGNYMGWNYRIADHRAELMFRICSSAFRERNFAQAGVANRYMGIGYAANVIRRFYPGPGAAQIGEQARRLTRAISLDTAEHLDRAAELAERVAFSDNETIERETALLGLSVADADQRFHVELDRLYAVMNAHGARAREAVRAERQPKRTLPSKLRDIARSMAVGASLAASGAACGAPAQQQPTTTTGAGDNMSRNRPTNGAADAGPTQQPYDAGPPMVVDPPPPDIHDVPMPVDPPPPDMHPKSLNADAMDDDPAPPGARRRLRLIDHWVDSSPNHEESIRTRDMPLFDPPAPVLRARRDGESVEVHVEGVSVAVSTRWESGGRVEGDGLSVRWTPRDGSDQIRVAVRSRGGVAVVTLRAAGL